MNDAVMSYPGSFHAPYVMLSTPNKAVMAAAATWPPHHVIPKRRMVEGDYTSSQPLLIDWVNGYDKGNTVTMSILLEEFDTDTATATAAWQAGILEYRKWLLPQLPPSPPPPKPTVGGQGFLAVGLENMASFNLTKLDASFREGQDVFGRVLVWGQMSNYCGPPSLAHPPLRPGEVVGCCVLNQSMHPRYLNDCGDLSTGAAPKPWVPGSQCLPAWARKLASEGTEVGYYVRKGTAGDLSQNFTWFSDWLADMESLGGNAQYVDTYSRDYNGRPEEVLKMIAAGTPKTNVVTEGWNDL
jgi:hypothetical protein